MSTLALIRLHRFNVCPERVWDAIAEHADGLLFLANNLLVPSLAERAAAHEKSVGVFPSTTKWHNHRLLTEGAKLIDTFCPDDVLIFDEDELPPAHFDEALNAWRMSGASTLRCRFFCTWGDPETIIAERCYSYGWHVKAYHWRGDVSAHGFQAFCTPSLYAPDVPFQCPWPLRHLAFQTPELRAARSLREKRPNKRWWDTDPRTVRFDPDMTQSDWLSLTEAAV